MPQMAPAIVAATGTEECHSRTRDGARLGTKQPERYLPNRVQSEAMMTSSPATDAIENIALIVVVAIVPLLGATVSQKRRRDAALWVTIAASPLGFVLDAYGSDTDGPSCGFVGLPLLVLILFFLGVVSRATFDFLFSRAGRKKRP